MNKKNRILISLLAILITINFSCSIPTDVEVIRKVNFDEDWRFIKADPEGAENPSFDDSDWRTLDLPHDWSIEDLPNQSDSVIGPFSKSSAGKMRTGYTLGGTAWYRKTFIVDKADSEKIAYVNFDGIYMNSDVWINEKHVGNHPYGYTSFYYNITPYLNPVGQPNVVAVQVKNEGSNARWCSGSGIYRHTWLTLVNHTHIGMWGVYVKTLSVSEESADVNITSTIINSGDNIESIDVHVQIIDPEGNVAATTENKIEVSPNESKEIEF